ncbi:MAG: DNA gyrase inhibitor YacG [Blastocatellia bacterium]|nr:DNA gyrase inhibitor YacG [Blastocatellia bacterium]
MRTVRCPYCSKAAEWDGNEYRPFCSERCKLLDLGVWIDEGYRLPTEAAELTEEDVDELDRTIGNANGD